MSFTDSMMDALTCPICLEPLSPPVYQCQNGHTACASCCILKLKGICPSCLLPIGGNRCVIVEKIIESLEIKCKYAVWGCKEMLQYAKLRKRAEHEDEYEAAAQSQIAILHSCYLNAMACTKLITAIINRTGQALVLKVGNQNCFAKLATVGVGGEHKVEIDVNWTYQEFSLEPATTGATLTKVIVNSDDCCDFERITVTESEGKFQVDKILRGQSNASDSALFKTWRSYFGWPKLNWRFWSST